MDYNYHTHTVRCNHATGTVEEYILSAIDAGIKHMGFADHVPFVFSDGRQSGYRVPVSEAKDYVAEIKELAEKYREKINIIAGFEAEFYAERFEETLKNVISYGAEYLILGQHYFEEDGIGAMHACCETEDVEYLNRYVDSVVSAVKTGAFSYVAHPDVMNFTGDKAIYRDAMRKICIASRECNIPLEINFLGIRDKRHYPSEVFWEIAGEEKCPVTFGMDAHSAESAGDKESEKTALELVEKFGLNYIGKPEITDIRKLV